MPSKICTIRGPGVFNMMLKGENGECHLLMTVAIAHFTSAFLIILLLNGDERAEIHVFKNHIMISQEEPRFLVKILHNAYAYV